jgi:hypothetical protein
MIDNIERVHFSICEHIHKGANLNQVSTWMVLIPSYSTRLQMGLLPRLWHFTRAPKFGEEKIREDGLFIVFQVVASTWFLFRILLFNIASSTILAG